MLFFKTDKKKQICLFYTRLSTNTFLRQKNPLGNRDPKKLLERGYWIPIIPTKTLLNQPNRLMWGSKPDYIALVFRMFWAINIILSPIRFRVSASFPRVSYSSLKEIRIIIRMSIIK